MTIGRITAIAVAVALVALLTWGFYDRISWEMYRIENGCELVQHEVREHYPDKTVYVCNGKEIVR